MVVIVRVVEEEAGVGDSVFGLDDRVVDLRNADEEDAVSSADDQRTRVAEGVGESGARSEIVGLERDLARRREQWVGEEPGGGEGLQVPADAETHRKMVGDANGVLGEGGVVVAVGVRGGAAEILQIVVELRGHRRAEARVRGPIA